MRILIIEDDRDTQHFLKGRLEEKCFAVDVADNGNDGIKMIQNNEYDVILLDYALPGKNGFTVCKETRNNPSDLKKHLPIIMMSVTDDPLSKIEGFDSGADDYINKPFFFDELFARIQAILRRPPVQQEQKLTIDDLIIDIRNQSVTRGTKAIYLTRKEFALLEYLVRNKGMIVSRNTITEHVWDASIDPFSNTIEMHILNLRKKIESKDKKKLIHSMPGRGYKIDTQR